MDLEEIKKTISRIENLKKAKFEIPPDSGDSCRVTMGEIRYLKKAEAVELVEELNKLVGPTIKRLETKLSKLLAAYA